MARDFNELDMSELEREFELEMEGDEESSDSDELEAEFEDLEFEGMNGYEAYEPELEFEEGDQEGTEYADRFYELSQRGYESESELDGELDGLLGEMEREYFFGGLKKAFKRNLPGIKRLLNRAKALALKHPALRGLKGLTGLSGLAQQILKSGSLKGLAKTAISMHPAGGAALTALKGLGFEASEDSEANRDAWNNYVDVAREAFESLAENLNERSDDPLEASRQATAAFETALHKVRARVPARARRRGYRFGPRGYQAGPRHGRRVIRVKRGERILIIGE